MTQEKSHALQVQGDRVVLGEWSGNLEELIATDLELRRMLREGLRAEARALVQAQSPEEQVALVAMDENPEEVLSLTGMDDKGRPGYSPAVVDKLPAEVVAEVLVPRNAKLVRFNTEVLQKMSGEAFDRVVQETLDPVYYQANRTKVAWEWLEAVAALEDYNKTAELLFQVEQSALEDALMDKVDAFDMHALIDADSFGPISAFRLFSESGQALMLPPITDPEVAEVIHALHRAAPELLARVVRNAWERAAGGGA
jgi:hypothetical protein